ncbi:MAG TPA: DNA mismatch repair protein MutS, partial [Anaerolineales bacterium]|nr:DNA mismatch repair protein MutS [Anaerolineales bacterium]
MSKDDLTPIRRQYLEIKRQYPDSILFFRLGDFYETFDEDAEIAARELDIVLTSRNAAKGKRIPMAGIPHHAAENYLARLIEAGYHVAICEQVGAQPVNGLMPREVVRVVTPGTLTEPGLLPGDANNYLVCLVVDEDAEQAGVAYVDVSTGEFAATELQRSGSGADIWNLARAELARLNPAEVLIPENLTIPEGAPGHLTGWPAWRFEPGRCYEALIRHFNVASLEGFGLREQSTGTRAAGGVLQYIKETQPAALKLLTALSTYSLSEFMTLDAATRRNLELTETIRGGKKDGSLLDVLDHTVTAMGKRLIRQWVSKPLLDVKRIARRQDGVGLFVEDGLLRAELRSLLKPLADVERLTNRVVSGSAQPRELVSLRDALRRLPDICALLPADNPALGPLLTRYDACASELDLLEQAITEDPPATLQNTGVFRPGYSAELQGVLERSAHARAYINNLEAQERQRTGIKSLKVGYNKVFGYYLEITHANTELVPDEYIRKQTLVNSER